MSFFYDLNKKLDSIRATPEVTHKQLNERDMSRAAKGYEKYGKQGMEALAKAGRDGKALDPIRKKYDKYDNKKVSEESGEWSKIPIGVIDGPGGYEGGQQRIKDYESGKINRDGKPLPPVVDKSRPADKPTVYNKSDSEEYSSPPEWKGGYRPPVVDRSRSATNEGPVSTGKKIYDLGKNLGKKVLDKIAPNDEELLKRLKKDVGGTPDPSDRSVNLFDLSPEEMRDRNYNSSQEKFKRSYDNFRDKTGLPPAFPNKAVRPPDMDEGLAGAGKKIYDLGKQAASGINKMIGHGSDEEMLGTLRKDMSVAHPTGSKRPTPPGMQSTGKRPPRDPDGEDNEIIRPDDPRAKQANAYFDKQVKEAGKKLNFADKIANAKKEVDEMLGDVAAEAMRSALSPKQKKIDMNKNGKLDANDFAMLRKGAKSEMDEERSKGTAFDQDAPRASTPKIGSIERGAKHDIKHTATGRMVTRRTDDQGNSVGADDDSEASGEKRGRGRPKGTKQSIGAKGPSGKSKLMTREDDMDPAEKGEYDREGDMALDDIDTIESAANELQSIIDANDNLPEWVQSKINKAMDYLDTARDYMSAQGNDQPVTEKAVSKQQQKFMGMAHAMQKGEKVKGASKELKKVARAMKPKDTEDFAKTKHKGLPEKKKKEVDETSEDGRITTTRTGPGKTLTTSSTGRISATIGNGKMSVKPGKPDKQMDNDTDTASNKDTSSSKSNSMVGKGIYDSMNRELELMIAESMSINMSDSTEGGKSLTITATDEDALKLGMLLKNAGLGGGDMHSHGEQPCATCGMPDCGCGDVQEAVDDNAPDYPTNTEQADNNFGYSGGLNKPKTDVAGDGQSTVPVTAVHTQEEDALRRMMEMAGLAEVAKPDYIDLDGDGNKKESMKDAAADVNEEEDTVEESIQRMREAAGIKIKNDLGPTSPEVARMSKDEVNAALRSGMNSKVDLGPTSPDIARMSNDEVNAALRSGMSPDISNMDSDSVNAEFNKDSSQYEDSIQRMREMAGIQEAKKEVDEEKTDEGNKFAFNVLKAKAAGKKEADLDGDGDMEKVRESIFALNNQWRAYKG